MRSSFQPGFVLTELLIAGLLTTFLMLGIIQMAAGVSRGLLLIESQSATHQGGRFAIDQIRNTAMSAGFDPYPWDSDTQFPALGENTRDGGAGGNDSLVVQLRSDHNCYGNPNSTPGDDGRPAFFLRESTIEVTPAGNLAHTCWFGPDGTSMVRQINRQGLVQHVDSFQVLYAEDTDGDQHANRLVRANGWHDANHIVGLEVGLLVASKQQIGGEASAAIAVLDETITPQADVRLRKTWTSSIPLFSRLR